ncbi:MAG: hypothetical protein OXC84_09965 [Gammaproteobacteria bacterium]|nr:hypothetical protein [Gammaproteobacteria bacterium]
MEKPILLDLELRLLIARHGRKEVLETLSEIKEVEVIQLDSDVKTFEVDSRERRAKRGRRRPRKSVKDIILDLDLTDPDIQSLVETLGNAYECKEFLPVLREVRRFLETNGVSTTKIRSRADALPTVLTTLSRRSIEELRVIDAERLDQRGDLGIIVDQVLGRRHVQHQRDASS